MTDTLGKSQIRAIKAMKKVGIWDIAAIADGAGVTWEQAYEVLFASKWHTRPEVYVIMVLWLKGTNEAIIERVSGKKRGVVRGLIARSPFNRSEMTIEQRQEVLSQFLGHRLDEYRLPVSDFVAGPLSSVQVRVRTNKTGAIETPVVPDAVNCNAVEYPVIPENTEAPVSKKKRKGKVEEKFGRNGEVQERVRYGDRGPILREKNVAAAPLEWLDERRILSDKAKPGMTDQQIRNANQSGTARFEAGIRARGEFEGAHISPLRAASLGDVVDGGKGGKLVSDHALECQDSIAKLKEMMPAGLFSMLELVVYSDEWVWKKAKNKSEQYERIRESLDHAALHYRYISRDDFTARWGEPKGHAERLLRDAIYRGFVDR